MKLYTAFSTFPDIEIARTVAKLLVEKKLVACVNLVPAVESIYHWEGEICEGNEVLAMMKTNEAKLPELKTALVRLHPYDVPEFIVIEIVEGHPSYLQWLKNLA